ncbi:MAG TPA: sulfotransferase [Thermoanaerobaculia bacterium]|nr:sulfotransferase [Thermoanaerobaculia bacterium]
MTKGSDDTPFFVLGAARSGTTMLRLMLNRHSRLAIPFESHFLRQIFAELPIDRPLDDKEASRMAEIVAGEKNFRTWHLQAANVRQELIGRAPAPLAVLVDALFRMEIARTGKPRWGDKTPLYYVCWRPLMRLFPGSRLIHIIRDGRDVNLSLEKVGWHGPTASDRARYWHERVEMAQAAARELGRERNMIIRYEDLVLDSRAALERVCDFLGETFEPAMLEFFEDAAMHISDIDGDVHEKLHRPPRPEDVGRWRREMTIERQREFEAVAGSSLRAGSYPCLFFNGGD